MKKAYYQIELDDKSKNLTAFLTPFGRMRYTHLPMGLNISSDEFDQNYGKAVDHLPNIARICEDTLIYGKQLIVECCRGQTSVILINLIKIKNISTTNLKASEKVKNIKFFNFQFSIFDF